MLTNTRNEYKKFNMLRLRSIENEREKGYPIDSGYMGCINGNYIEYSDEGDYNEIFAESRN